MKLIRTVLAAATMLCLSCGGGADSGGGSWKLLTTFTALGDSFYDVAFTSPTVGYVSAGRSFLAKTVDGGATWKKLSLDGVGSMNAQSVLLSLSFQDDNHGWVAGNGWLLQTTDGGASWTNRMPQDSARYIPAPQAVAFSDATHGVVVGMYGKALFTADGGATWQVPSMDADYTSGKNASDFYSVSFINASTGWLAGTGEALLKTADGGKTWQTLNDHSSSLTTTPLTNQSFRHVQFLDAGTGYLTGNFAMLKTIDGGKTWANLAGSPQTLTFVFVSPTVGFADASNLAGFSVTSDGGATWSSAAAGKTGQVRGMSFLNASQGWAVTGGGGVYRYQAN